MPTFEQLLTARLGPMETAVTQWTVMIGKLKTPLQADAEAMKAKADKSSWKGDNATVTKAFVTKTAKEFGDAVTEAESVRDLLKDAHGLFKSAQDDLKHAYENPPPGIVIYPNGVLSHRVHPDRRSKDSTEPIATEAQFEALRGKLEGILKRADEADELCAWGLRALIRNHSNDFGSTDLSGIADARRMRAEEKQQAENGREAAKLYARWEHLDDEERERLLEYAEQGKNSPAFAEQLMTHLSYRGRDQQEAVLLLVKQPGVGRPRRPALHYGRPPLQGAVRLARHRHRARLPDRFPRRRDLGVDQQAHHHGPRRQRPPRASPRLHRRRRCHVEGPHGPDGRGQPAARTPRTTRTRTPRRSRPPGRRTRATRSTARRS